MEQLLNGNKSIEVITIGEAMVSFKSNQTGYLRYSHSFEKSYAGSELNVAIGISRMNHSVGWISRVGDDEFGKALTSFVSSEGIDNSLVKTDDVHSTGIMFKEYLREGKMRIQYYRENSAASKMTPLDLDISYFKNAKFLFISGITVLISESCYEVVLAAIEYAKRENIQIVFDPNIRKKLWNYNNSKEKFINIIKQSDIILPGLIEAEILFGTDDLEEITHTILNLGPKIVVVKLGKGGAFFSNKKESSFVKGYKVERPIDPVGAGDAFASGLISGLLDGLDLYESVKRANAFGAIVVQVVGDYEGLPERQELDGFQAMSIEDIER